MAILSLISLAILIYYIIYVFLWLVLDCNVLLWYKQHFGVSVATLRGKVIWITGASSGIGHALALNLAQHGVRLVLSARREEQLQELKEKCIVRACGVLTEKDVLVMQMDMLNIAKHQEHFDNVIKHFGRVDVLVNNAGRSQRAEWKDIDVQVDRDIFELDVFSLMNLSRIVVRYFLESYGGRGHIAATSSIAGIGYVPFSSSYCAAKHALNAYLNCLRLEVPTVDVTIFAPGPVATDFLREAFTDVTDVKYNQSTKDQKRLTAERCADLFAVSLANKMDVTWCALFPVNFIAYCMQSVTLSKILTTLMSQQTMKKIREGKL